MLFMYSTAGLGSWRGNVVLCRFWAGAIARDPLASRRRRAAGNPPCGGPSAGGGDDLRERLGFEAGAADERAVDIGRRSSSAALSGLTLPP